MQDVNNSMNNVPIVWEYRKHPYLPYRSDEHYINYGDTVIKYKE